MIQYPSVFCFVVECLWLGWFSPRCIWWGWLETACWVQSQYFSQESNFHRCGNIYSKRTNKFAQQLYSDSSFSFTQHNSSSNIRNSQSLPLCFTWSYVGHRRSTEKESHNTPYLNMWIIVKLSLSRCTSARWQLKKKGPRVKSGQIDLYLTRDSGWSHSNG
jgi:hypothetical protein